MKKLIYMLAAAALVSAGAVSCSDEKTDDPVEPVTVSSSMRLNGGNVLVNVPEADFDVSIPDEASSWVGVNEAETEGRTLVLEVAKNETGAERQTTVTVTRKGRSDLLATVTIKQSNVAAKNGEFVIEEIYFTGTALPETGSPDKYQGDQYIKIRNNTDEDLYADGMLLILQSSVLSNMEGEIPAAVDFREEYCAGQAFYAIPGSGRDVPVKAGESLIIVNNAQNHLESNPDSWDATTADFEWYDESSNENFLDTDQPRQMVCPDADRAQPAQLGRLRHRDRHASRRHDRRTVPAGPPDRRRILLYLPLAERLRLRNAHQGLLRSQRVGARRREHGRTQHLRSMRATPGAARRIRTPTGSTSR